MRNPNWPAIRHEYLAGYIDENGAHKHYTLEQLAERHGLAHATLLAHSSEEKWTAQREAFQEKIYRQAFTQFESDMAAYLSETDRLAARIGTSMLRYIDRRFEQAESDRERDALIAKYGKVLNDLINASHNGVGVERILERVEKKYGLANIMGC